MEKALYLFVPFLLLLPFSSLLASQSPFTPPRLSCHEDERSALLEFKGSIQSQFPQNSCFNSWSLEDEARNCCSWQGITCGGPSSHVIGLNLRDCRLNGSINSNTTIFRLVHLQVLNLDLNDFNYSPIPSSLGNLQSLRELTACSCKFHGPLPASVSNLTKLISLDLSYNSFQSPIPSEILSLTHLQMLDLSGCELQGPIPPSVSNLTKLVTLDLSFNSFHSQIPFEIASLTLLQVLGLADCEFQGLISPLMSNLTQLYALDLSFNSLQGPILPFFLNLTQLLRLDLSDNQFTGNIPPSVINLFQLAFLHLDSNQFTGEIPYHIGNLTHLEELDLSFNRLRGQIPTSLSKLRNLYILRLGPNNLSGMVQLDMFLGMEQLEELILSFSNSSLTNGSMETYSLPSVRTLGLAQCNLKEFPAFLEKLNNLVELDLSYNNFSGELSEWFLNERLQTLSYLNLSGNSLTGFPRDLSYYNRLDLNP